MYFPFGWHLELVTVIEDWNADKKMIGAGVTIPSLFVKLCRNAAEEDYGHSDGGTS